MLSAIAAGGAGLVLAGCGSSAGGTGTGGGDGGGGKGWTFTDDTGKTVTLPERPTRIAGFYDAVTFDGKDVSEVVEVGRPYGQINIEALAAASPDLIVTKIYPTPVTASTSPRRPTIRPLPTTPTSASTSSTPAATSSTGTSRPGRRSGASAAT